MTLDTILGAFIRQGGIVGLVAVLFLALQKEWLVLGHVHTRMLADRDKQLSDMTVERNMWRALALSGSQIAENLASIAATNHGETPFDAIRHGPPS